MKQIQTAHKSGTRTSQSSNLDRPGLLEIEIDELREANDRLRQRLEEVELRAEFRVTAHRLLAIPFSPRD